MKGLGGSSSTLAIFFTSHSRSHLRNSGGFALKIRIAFEFGGKVIDERLDLGGDQTVVGIDGMERDFGDMPICQQADEAAGSDVGANNKRRQKGDAQAAKGG